MKRKLLLVMTIVSIIVLTSCGDKTLENAETAVNLYNEQLSIYNEQVLPFNTAVQEINEANAKVDDLVTLAQSSVSKGESPYDPNTYLELKTSLNTLQATKVQAPDSLPSYKKISIEENADKETLKLLTEQAKKDLETMKTVIIPEIPEVLSYAEVLQNTEISLKNYNDSVQALKLVTAPSDAFVMERLKRVDTILAMDAVTEDNDPNQQLNKQGGYIGCIFFSDKQVDRSKLYIDVDTVIGIATDGGGAIEIFKSKSDAEKRNEYLSAFDGGVLSSGSHHVLGTVVIRTSTYLKASQQLELTEKIKTALLELN